MVLDEPAPGTRGVRSDEGTDARRPSNEPAGRERRIEGGRRARRSRLPVRAGDAGHDARGRRSRRGQPRLREGREGAEPRDDAPHDGRDEADGDRRAAEQLRAGGDRDQGVRDRGQAEGRRARAGQGAARVGHRQLPGEAQRAPGDERDDRSARRPPAPDHLPLARREQEPLHAGGAAPDGRLWLTRDADQVRARQGRGQRAADRRGHRERAGGRLQHHDRRSEPRRHAGGRRPRAAVPRRRRPRTRPTSSPSSPTCTTGAC